MVAWTIVVILGIRVIRNIFIIIFFFRTNDLEKKSSKLKMIRGAQNQIKNDLTAGDTPVSALYRCDLCP